MEGPHAQSGHREVCLETVYLSPKRVTLDANVHQRKIGTVETWGPLRHDDRTGAGSPNGQSLACQFAQWLDQVVGVQQPGNGGALAARNYEAVKAVELGAQA